MGPDIAGPDDGAQWEGLLWVGESLTSWLLHLAENEWVEYGSIPGEIDKLPSARRSRLREHYRSLNPDLTWC